MSAKKTKAARKKSRPTAAAIKEALPIVDGDVVPENHLTNEPSGVVHYGLNGEVELWPHPGELLQEAQQEPNYRNLADYASVIRTLRDKGFSFREIAEWMTARGVEADHNAVYRVFSNTLTQSEAHEEAIREEEEAKAEAIKESR